jgi:hypothetical protein
MFRATMGPLSGETTVFMRHLVLVILCGWLSITHGQQNIKFGNAKQAKQIRQYKNTKTKLYKTNAAVWYNKTCRLKQFCQVSALNRVQNRAAKFANNVNESGWKTLAQRRLIARICALFKAYAGGRAWKAIGDRLLKPCYLSREDHNRKIRTRKQKRDVGKYSCVKVGTNYLQAY